MPDSVGLEIENLDQILRAIDALGLAPKKVIEKATLAAAEVVRDEAENKLGRDGINKKVLRRKGDQVEVGVGPVKDKWYLRFYETGTQPHEITPKTAKALSISDEDMAARVSHPGMAAKPFLRPALDEKKGEAAKAAGKIYAQELKKHGRS
jgi:HK97 gp10 family phage protein